MRKVKSGFGMIAAALGSTVLLLAGCATKREENPAEPLPEVATVGGEPVGNVAPAGEESPVEGTEEGRNQSVATAEVLLGEITYVDRQAGFVLVRSSYAAQVRVGKSLKATSAGGEATGLLTLSPERKRRFLVADIRDGEPAVGNRVYYEAEIQSVAPAPPSIAHDSGTTGKSKYSRPGRIGR